MNNRVFELNESWYIAKDGNNEGIASGWENHIHPSAVKAFVPSIIQQFFPEYHGLAYYWCQFTPDVCRGENDRLILRFGGVDYKADVWLNGVFLGTRECPETPFEFDVTEALCDGENLLSVRVLNPCDHNIDGINLLNVPHRNKVIKKQAGSCLNHGGMWYGVTLESRPAAYIDDVFTVSDYKSGEVKAKDKSQKELRQDYVTCVFGLAIFFASYLFCLSPHIGQQVISGYTQRRNERSGETEDNYIYSIVFDRDAFEKGNHKKSEHAPPENHINYNSQINEYSVGL